MKFASFFVIGFCFPSPFFVGLKKHARSETGIEMKMNSCYINQYKQLCSHIDQSNEHGHGSFNTRQNSFKLYTSFEASQSVSSISYVVIHCSEFFC